MPEITRETTNAFRKADFNLQTDLQMKQMARKAECLKAKLNEIQAQITPGRHIKTNLNTYQTPEYNKQTHQPSKLVAEIRLPCKNGNGRIIDLHLDNSEISELLKQLTYVTVA